MEQESDKNSGGFYERQEELSLALADVKTLKELREIRSRFKASDFGNDAAQHLVRAFYRVD